MLEKELKGTIWSLVTYQSEDKNGNINYPLGDEAKGYIIFTENNILSVQLMATGRDKEVPAEIIEKMNTPVEEEMAKRGYHAYSGPYTLDEESDILTTDVELSLIPNYVGSQQHRKASIEEDKLYLSNIEHPERKLVWTRVK